MGTLLAGCAPSGGGLPDGVGATLIQQRADVAVRELQVRVRNDRDDAITLGAVSLDDERFAGTATRAVERESSLAAGASVDVRVRLPEMDCDVGDEGMPRVTLRLVIDGEPVEASAAVTDALDVLPGIHASECLAERLDEVADVEIADFDEGTGMLHLTVIPTGGAGTARLDAVQPTPLLTYDAGPARVHDLDVEIAADGAPASIDIPLVPQRCDPHVVQEDKRGTVFTFDVEVDGAAGRIDLVAPPALKARLLTWVAQRCGFG